MTAGVRPKPSEQRRPKPSRRVGPWIATVLVILISGAAAVLHSPWMSLDEVDVIGAVQADVAEIIAGLGIGDGALMIYLDTAEVEAAVASHAWVRDVKVSRDLPDRLVVEVIEREPILWIEAAPAWLLVSADGTVLEHADRPEGGMLLVEVVAPLYPIGSAPVDPSWAEYLALAGILDPGLAARTRLVLRGEELWMDAGGVDVRLGRAAELADKGRVTQQLLAEGIEPGASIDVVSPLRPAIIPPVVPAIGSTPGSEGEVDG